METIHRNGGLHAAADGTLILACVCGDAIDDALDHGSINRTRADRIYGNISRSEFSSKPAGHTDHTGLGSTVSSSIGKTVLSGNGGNIDNASGKPLFQKNGDNRPCAEKSPRGIDGQIFVPDLGTHLLDGHTDGHTCVVYQNLDGMSGFYRTAHHIIYLIFLTDVHFDPGEQ